MVDAEFSGLFCWGKLKPGLVGLNGISWLRKSALINDNLVKNPQKTINNRSYLRDLAPVKDLDVEGLTKRILRHIGDPDVPLVEELVLVVQDVLAQIGGHLSVGEHDLLRIDAFHAA